MGQKRDDIAGRTGAPALRVDALPGDRPTPFEVEPDAAARAAVAGMAGLDAVHALVFAGTVTAEGKRNWRLEGRLRAEIEQPCVATQAPVRTAIDTPVLRRFLADPPDADQPGEVEMPEDETIEQLGDEIDPVAVMVEALTLAAPLYPRAEDAELGEAVYGPPGVEPLRDEDMKPLAGLADLRRRMQE